MGSCIYDAELNGECARIQVLNDKTENQVAE